ncbi:hypothetical protein DCC81_24220 [Chitinophaga parva]|uniref:Uncharacterized protein n=1 Tax=Chitinophaga parva TaxID=2169414 RepID=A0A2T7BBE2_9BACT|nr:hypothetical protein [Chitinophaga parva]PUZ21700.1 hypothetical protein DCC81_24220 [Chitinophaga parva]
MNFSTQNILIFLLCLGGIYVLYTTIRDLVKKPSKEEEAGAPAAPETSTGTATAAAFTPAAPADRSTLPLQLAAYERLVLLVERLTPQSLINRVYNSEMTAADMHVALVHTIKAEFDHNITQQIYVSAGAWDAVKTVKENTIALINQTYGNLGEGATATDLNRAILGIYMQFPESPTDIASQIISNEAKRIMA